MKTVLFVITTVFLWSTVASARVPVKRGVAKATSKHVFNACIAAKQKANTSHCKRGAIEKNVGQCECFETVEGWSCDVGYAEACRTDTLGRSSFTWTGTMVAKSRRSEAAACENAKTLSKSVGCPSTFLEREMANSCACEPGPDGWSCMLDQTLWCQN